jgi:phosphoglycolate phosphatase-like HAD superfamily hydrolase
MRMVFPGWLLRQRDSAALLLVALLLAACATTTPAPATSDPLPSWRDGANKAAIIKLVQDTTTSGSPDFVPVAERIATFDNDGTLWAEQPMYVEVLFTRERIRQIAPQHPEWRSEMPFKAVIDNDVAAMDALDVVEGFKLIAATHAGTTSVEFQKSVTDWLATSRHPRFNRPYTELVYQPMLEVLAYLRANGYKTFMVTGGSLDFVRAFAEKLYGIPPEQVVGTSYDAKYSFTYDVAVLRAEPRVMLLDDGPGKAVGIDHSIGRVPIAAFGNSDGDLAMLETTTQGPTSRAHKRLAMIVWHTDAAREYAYDRESGVGRLNIGLDAASRHSWKLISMKDDWKVVFPFEAARQ